MVGIVGVSIENKPPKSVMQGSTAAQQEAAASGKSVRGIYSPPGIEESYRESLVGLLVNVSTLAVA